MATGVHSGDRYACQMMWTRLEIDLDTQQLRAFAGTVPSVFGCSTSRLGAGEGEGSGQTPRGLHRVRARIGDGLDPLAVFVGRRPTGEHWSPQSAQLAPDRDWILGRILWLCGEETGLNRGGDCDSQRRFIYIHGTPPTEPMGEPRSHGCVRLHPETMVTLFERTPVGCPVWIR